MMATGGFCRSNNGQPDPGGFFGQPTPGNDLMPPTKKLKTGYSALEKKDTVSGCPKIISSIPAKLSAVSPSRPPSFLLFKPRGGTKANKWSRGAGRFKINVYCCYCEK